MEHGGEDGRAAVVQVSRNDEETIDQISRKLQKIWDNPEEAFAQARRLRAALAPHLNERRSIAASYRRSARYHSDRSRRSGAHWQDCTMNHRTLSRGAESAVCGGAGRQPERAREAPRALRGRIYQKARRFTAAMPQAIGPLVPHPRGLDWCWRASSRACVELATLRSFVCSTDLSSPRGECPSLGNGREAGWWPAPDLGRGRRHRGRSDQKQSRRAPRACAARSPPIGRDCTATRAAAHGH